MKLAQFPTSVKAGHQTAILRSLETYLRNLLNDQPGEPYGALVGIHATGQPPTIKGQWYFAVHPVNLGGTSKEANYVDNVTTVGITLSVKRTHVPRDREKDGVLCGDQQAIDIVDYLCSEQSIHGSYDPIITTATALLGGTGETKQGFITPLFFQMQRWEEKTPDWWRSGTGEVWGYACQITYQGANYTREKVYA